MKKMLIATYGMYSGGVETSLLSFLNIVKNNYEITLLLLKKEGANLSEIPKNIKIITIPFYKEYYDIFENSSTKKRFIRKYYKTKNKVFTLLHKRNYANNFFLKYSKELDDEYDVAIDYHGYGYFATGYIAKKVKSKKKYTWIHSSNLKWTKNTEQFFQEYDKIFAVSNYAKEEFLKKYPNLESKLDVFYNVIDYDKIYSLSNIFIPNFSSTQKNLLTVGRLEQEKGYDLLLDIAHVLKSKKLDFKWFIIGKGSQKEHIEKRIKSEKLIDNVILLGEQKNPYPFFKSADMYIQTSNFEGYGLTIAEAKIFNKIIVCTDLPTFKEQLYEYTNGVTCEPNARIIADTILKKIKEDKNIKKTINNQFDTNKYVLSKIE